MHELGVTQSLIDVVKYECEKNNIVNPKRVVVELGSLTSFKKDPILFYFDILKEENPLICDTELVINEIEGVVKCFDCEKESVIEDPCLIFCMNCDSTNVEVVKGKEFIIKEIEIE